MSSFVFAPVHAEIVLAACRRSWSEREGMTEDEIEDAWVAEGATIRDLIQTELGPDYQVEYET